MDKATIKMALGAYQPSRQNEGDPLLAEALREVERDPDLAAWFKEEQRFDSLMADALKQTPTPDGLKELLLLNAQSAGKPSFATEETSDPWRRHVKTWLAMAAGLMLAFALGRQTLPNAAPPPATENSGARGANPLALQAIAYTGKMPALQFVCFDAKVVARWIDEKAVALNMGKLLDKPMTSMQMVGSSAAQWEGKPVIMIALQNEEQMAMLYLVRAADFPGEAKEAGEIMEKDGWVSETGRRGEHLYVLTTKGTRKNLRFPMPL